MTCISGPPCKPGKTAELIFFAHSFLAQDEPAARSAQRLVRRRGHEVGERHRAGMLLPGHQARDVGHVHHEQRADFVRKSAEASEIDLARIGAGPGDDQLRPMLAGQLGDLIEIDALVGLRARRSRRSCTICRRS